MMVNGWFGDAGISIPLVAIAIGLTVVVWLASLYFQTTKGGRADTPGGKLIAVAKAYRLGNTLALKPMQRFKMDDPNDWKAYGPNPDQPNAEGAIYEPEFVKSRSWQACVLCVIIVFMMSLALMGSLAGQVWAKPTMILGAGFGVPLAAECITGSPLCTDQVTQSVQSYQIGALKIIIISFLCAYIWAIWQLFRRMVARDVTAYAFHAITVRVVTASILSLVIYHLFDGKEPSLVAWLSSFGTGQAQAQSLGGAVTPAQPAMGFFVLVSVAIGFFPETVIRWLGAWAKGIFAEKGAKERSSDLSLDAIEGIDTFTRVRLAEAEIYDAQGLASANPLILMVKTPFGLHQILDWVGQAQLLLQVKEAAFTVLRDAGVRTSFQLCKIARGDDPQSKQALQRVTGLLQQQGVVDLTVIGLENDMSFERAYEIFEHLISR